MDTFKTKTCWLLGLLLLLLFLYTAREALVVVFTAFIFASAMLPLVDKLDRRLPRWLAVLIPYAILLIVLLVLVVPVLEIAWRQLQAFSKDLPSYLDQAFTWSGQWDFFSRRYPFLSSISPGAVIQHLSSQNGPVLSGFTGVTMAMSQVAVDVLSALVISIFLLLEHEHIKSYLLRFQPVREHERLTALIDNLIHSTGAFVNGQLMFMATFGGLIAAGLYFIGLPFSVLLGTLTGALTIIPIIGPNIAMVPTLIIALLSPGGAASAIWVFILYIAVQVLANNVIGPLIMGRAVGLHPLGILLAILFGGIMFGMVGIVLAIPVAACLKIIVEEWLLDPEHRLDRLLKSAESPLAET